MSGIRKNKALALLGLGFAVLFWAINTVVAKGVIAQINPLALSFFRWLAALIFIFPFAFKGLKKDIIPIRQNLGFIFALSIPSVAVYNSVLYMGAQYTTATNISLVVAAMPAMTLGFVWMINRQRLMRLQALGILVSLAGVMVIISKGSFALCIFPFYIGEYILYKGFEVNASIVWMFVYLGVCPSILSYVCWNHGVKIVGPGTASIFMYLIPVFTSVIAYFFLGERLFAYHLAGGLLVFCGLILSSRQ